MFDSLNLPNADVRFDPSFLPMREAGHLFQVLRDDTPWRHDTITVYGKAHPLPRLQQWYGDDGLTYTWSGIKMSPLPWTETLQGLRDRVGEATGVMYNTVLLNLYRDGQDTVSPHSDNERELGLHPVIASLSLGAERDFLFRHKTKKEGLKIRLPHGFL